MFPSKTRIRQLEILLFSSVQVSCQVDEFGLGHCLYAPHLPALVMSIDSESEIDSIVTSGSARGTSGSWGLPLWQKEHQGLDYVAFSCN